MPGAGQIIASNWLATSAERDGSVIGFTERALPYLRLMGDQNIRFDPRAFSFIGSPEQTNRGCFVTPHAPATTAHELFTKEILVGGAGAGTSITNTPILLSKLLGLKFKLVEGYGSAEHVVLAMERGELHGLCQTVGGIRATKPGWIEQGKLKVLFTMEHDRVPGIDAPTIHEFTTSKEQSEIIALYNSSLELGRPLVAPPGVPPDRVEALRRSFDAMMLDREFLEDAHRARFEITPRAGEKLQEVVNAIMAASPAIIERTKALTK